MNVIRQLRRLRRMRDDYLRVVCEADRYIAGKSTWDDYREKAEWFLRKWN